MFSGVTSGLRDVSGLPLLAGVGWIVGVMAIATLGALVVWRRRSLVQGWLLTGFAFFWAVALFAYHFFGFPFLGVGALSTLDLSLVRTLIAIGDSAFALAVVSFVFLLFVGPDGTLPSPRWRWVAGFLLVFAPFMVWGQVLNALKVIDADAWLARSSWYDLAGTASRGPADQALDVASTAVAIPIMFLMGWALWHRIRTAEGEKRQQLKWIALGCSAVLVWWALWFPVPEAPWLSTAQTLLPGPALILFAVGFGMALFKYRLWDIDVVVRRSLVYGVLWLVIAGVYVGVAAGLGMLASAQLPISAAIILTAVATLVFQPARRRLENAADRWVFGKRASPVDALQTLGGMAGSGRPHDIAVTLADTVSRALVVGWVRVDVENSPPVETGVRNDEPETSLPLAWGGDRFGHLQCQPQRGAKLDDEDLPLLETLVSQAALAIAHARMATRIVNAQEEERRRIERNIHDGTQQDLTNLVAQLGIARANADGDLAVVAELGRIQHDAQRILGDLRQLAQGIYPSVLRDGGLVSAIEDRCSRLPIDVDVRINPKLSGSRLPADVEAAAYFFAAEALSNVLKHAEATMIHVALDLDEDFVRVKVGDDGIGFDPDVNEGGSGILGLADRIRALGGDLVVTSNHGHGTVVSARIPAPEMTTASS
jgi:signal transduction histidine kinase